ncbi:MAG: hypothetical protein JSS86_25950 [Cyanobacteria bacterium SZAS LIN-2]|nr:hypothetical protein [Cyanobacteria bacterium SZAS LIN-2]
MADSTPSLQNSAGMAEFGHTAPESFMAGQLASSQKEATSRLAMEVLASNMAKSVQPGTESTDKSLIRAASVLAGGVTDGFIDSAKNSFNLHTAGTVLETAGIGYTLGAVAKAGPIGQKIALAGGLVMGASWVVGEIRGGRPQATINAVADAYASKDNVAQDRKIVAETGGAMVFDTTLAMAAGGLGMKKGLELKSNWHVDALASTQAGYGKAVDFLARDSRVNGAHVLREGDMGMAFAGKDAKVALGPVEMARDIISGKPRAAASMADIQETFQRSQAQRNDAHLLEMRGKLVDLEAQHAQIRAEESALAPKLTRLTREKGELASFDSLEQTIRIRQQSLTDAQNAGRELGPKKKELDQLFAAKQEAFQRQVPKEGQPVDQALRDEFQAKHQQFLDKKAQYDDLKADSSPEAIQRHRESLAEAQAALQKARAEQPGKIAAYDQEIAALEEQMGTLRTQRLALEQQIKPIVDSYGTRLDLVTKDPTQLVQAQFEPPAPPKVAEPKKVVREQPVEAPAPVVHTEVAKVDLTPTQAHSITSEVLGKATPAETTGSTAKVADAGVKAVEAAPPAVKAPETRAVETPVKERAAEVTDSAVSSLSREAQQSREIAMKAVKSNEMLREKEYVTKVLGEIERGTYRPTNRASVSEVKTEMERRLTEVNQKLDGDPGIKYTRALKAVLQYSRSIGKQLAETADMGQRDVITAQGLKDVEGMMSRLPTSYKGYQGKLPDLTEPNRLGRTGSPEKRFAEVQEHLEGKVSLLDDSRARQVAEMADRQPTLKELVKRLDSAQLPDDGSVILIGKDGKYLGPQGGTSPYFIEVSRMKAHGVGADGGGFNRFEHIQGDIAGAVILRPIYENGKPVELPSRSANGKPVYKKIVADMFGDVPDGIKPDLNFVDILRRFAPARS